MLKLIQSLFKKTILTKKIFPDNWEKVFEHRLEILNGNQRWFFSYKLFKNILDSFDFDGMDELADLISRYHSNNLTDTELKHLNSIVEYARLEYYLSLNEIGDFAYLLLSKTEFNKVDVLKSINFMLKIGQYNFQANTDERIVWENKIELYWNEFIKQEKIT